MLPIDQPIPYFAALAVAGAAVYTDSRRGIIPNRLTVPAMAGGLALRALLGGWDGFLTGGAGLLTGFGVLLVPFLFLRLGAGDVKLMGALGAFLGPELTFDTFLCSSLFGAATGLFIMLRRFGWLTVMACATGNLRTLTMGVSGNWGSFPYAGSILAGLATALLFGWR